MYCGHARLCVCLYVCLSAAACLHSCTDPDVTWGSGRGYPLVVHYWADLQSVHGLRCDGSISRARNVSKYMLVLALCLVSKLQALSHIVRTKFSYLQYCHFGNRYPVTITWFMVALCNRETIYIFMLFLLFFPRLISAVGDWMFTILWHMVWP